MNKTGLYLLIIALLCTLPLVFSSCSECEHVWDKGYVAKEATHEVEGYRIHTCLECGEQKAVAIAKLPHMAKDHTYEKSKWGYDSTYHWLKCDYDECEATTNKAPHTLTQSPNGGYICQLCRGEVNDHTFTNNHSSNEQMHWIQCDDEGCAVVAFKEPHTFTNDNVVITDTHHWLQCSKDGCSAISEKSEHVWEKNEENELECSFCHIPKPEEE